MLSCSDSRVPPEIIFDAGLGDMFTVRTAGEMLDQAVLHDARICGLVAARESARRALLHQHCAAVAQAEKELDALTEHTSPTKSTDAQERERIMEDLDEVIASSSSEFLKKHRHLRMAGPHGRP